MKLQRVTFFNCLRLFTIEDTGNIHKQYYFKDDLLAISDQRVANGCLNADEIHWVLTVPAIWNDAAKQFMREAAEAVR